MYDAPWSITVSAPSPPTSRNGSPRLAADRVSIGLEARASWQAGKLREPGPRMRSQTRLVDRTSMCCPSPPPQICDVTCRATLLFLRGGCELSG